MEVGADANVLGFDGGSEQHRVKRINMIRDIVNRLHNRAAQVANDFHSVREAVEYDPNTDLEQDSLIHEAFQEQRVA